MNKLWWRYKKESQRITPVPRTQLIVVQHTSWPLYGLGTLRQWDSCAEKNELESDLIRLLKIIGRSPWEGSERNEGHFFVLEFFWKFSDHLLKISDQVFQNLSTPWSVRDNTEKFPSIRRLIMTLVLLISRKNDPYHWNIIFINVLFVLLQ